LASHYSQWWEQQWWEEQRPDPEELVTNGRHDLVYENIKTLTWKRDGNRGIAIKDCNGKFLQDPEEVRRRRK